MCFNILEFQKSVLNKGVHFTACHTVPTFGWRGCTLKKKLQGFGREMALSQEFKSCAAKYCLYVLYVLYVTKSTQSKVV
jgi:hypothetical protein